MLLITCFLVLFLEVIGVDIFFNLANLVMFRALKNIKVAGEFFMVDACKSKHSISL
jgi:hypothetical protein